MVITVDEFGVKMSIQEIEETDLITSAALEEKKKLRKHFGRFDIYFFLICTIVGVDTIGQMASNGAQGFLWLIFMCIFFFIPYGLFAAELGSTFPEEGGAYIWTRMAWGRKVAGINSIFYWFANPVWIGATLSLLAIQTISDYFFNIDSGSFMSYFVGIVYIWFSVLSAVFSFGVGKWIPTIGAFSRIIMIGLFSITTIIYGIQNGLHIPTASDWTPTWPAFIALVPLVFYNLVGFEVPNSAGDEMKNPKRDVPFTILRAMFTSILLYGLPVLAIVMVIPTEKISGVSGFLDAIATVFTVYGSASGVLLKFMAFTFIMALVSSGAAWLMGADRTEAIASIDGTGPRWLGKFSSRYGTPVNVNMASGIVSTMVFFIAVNLGDGSTSAAFSVMIGIVLLFTNLSYLVIFPSIVKLRKTHSHANRPYSVPGGMKGVWAVAIITTFWSAFASLTGMFPGLFSNGMILDDSALPDGVTRAQYTSYVFIAIGVTLLVGVIFYYLGRETRSELVKDPELPVEQLTS